MGTLVDGTKKFILIDGALVKLLLIPNLKYDVVRPTVVTWIFPVDCILFNEIVHRVCCCGAGAIGFIVPFAITPEESAKTRGAAATSEVN